jgi:hypothetical protein
MAILAAVAIIVIALFVPLCLSGFYAAHDPNIE